MFSGGFSKSRFKGLRHLGLRRQDEGTIVRMLCSPPAGTEAAKDVAEEAAKEAAKDGVKGVAKDWQRCGG